MSCIVLEYVFYHPHCTTIKFAMLLVGTLYAQKKTTRRNAIMIHNMPSYRTYDGCHLDYVASNMD